MMFSGAAQPLPRGLRRSLNALANTQKPEASKRRAFLQKLDFGGTGFQPVR
jgi:hypothetical protein